MFLELKSELIFKENDYHINKMEHFLKLLYISWIYNPKVFID